MNDAETVQTSTEAEQGQADAGDESLLGGAAEKAAEDGAEKGAEVEGGETSEGDADEGEAATGAPDAYEAFDYGELPDGATIDESRLDAFQALAKDANLSQAGAQKFVDMYRDMMGDAQQAGQAAMETMIADQATDWVQATKSDSEIGGDALTENLAVAEKALDQFGTPELTEFLNKSGAGNNPELIRMMVKVGKAIAEDTLETGKDVVDAETTRLERMYK